MSGHSKWSTIKRKKGALDAQRGKIFTKIAREIMVAAKDGGGDPAGNPRLRTALLAAKAANMPKENQERAIKKGTGELAGVTFEDVVYEGRGPGGSCFIVEVLTDNKNRTVAEIRSYFGKSGGEMVSSGAVAWMFDHKGVLEVPKAKISEEALMERALGAGGEDIQDWGETWAIMSSPTDLAGLQSELADLEPTGGVQYIVKPENEKAFEGDLAVSVAKLWAKLDEHDDVQSCYTNATLPDDVMEEHGP
ncbi:YebC/PmpR family DNA-binding transcriptional regulator [Nannocystis pusilla]|uniref:Probable transcriptional regulatory protein K7C98_34910 n=1 Tax=Nannocystis pusilla TaxID=889268 RepID=A0ABS7U277_9BACT|nr:YebC/PmpR family DNA-binding transcriptional regulator [Nannocystis pusilla]MBZ5714452.1 YebC/PmpR family DNA-binding transcriptional regulator [Nannocystis pusilla]